MRFFFLSFVLATSLLTSQIIVAGTTEKITILEYHTFPPMVVSESRQSGLTFGFARLLNRHSSQYQFDVALQDLPTVISQLESGEPAVVLFVSPIWFDDVDQEKYRWTQPVYQLRDEVVSRKRDAFEYAGPKSLIGLTVAGIEGYTYLGLDSLVEKGLAKRRNYATDQDVLSALISDDSIDVAIVNSGPLSFYTATMDLSERIYLSEQPQGEYPVRILVSRSLPRVFEFMEYIVELLPSNKAWQDMRKLYLEH